MDNNFELSPDSHPSPSAQKRDTSAEDEGLRVAYAAIAPKWPGLLAARSPSLPDPSPPPQPAADHPLVDFYRPTSSCSVSAGDRELPATAASHL